MSIKLQLPKLTDLKPRITVVGVGGAGGNALNNMIASGLTGVEFVAANTDAQALTMSAAEHRLQLGVNLTEGLGAGSKPEVGEAAALEAEEDIRQQLSGSHMCFIAAGMGGGTGTGAAAVIARIAQDLGILTVGVVTKPFQFEGARRMRQAEAGITELRQHVDTLIVIPNQNLFRVATERTTFADAFRLADQILHSGVACIVDLIVREGLINLDFADVRTVMSGMGNAMMGTGEASGERRAIQAAEAAIHNPLIDDISLKGAKGLLLSVTALLVLQLGPDEPSPDHSSASMTMAFAIVALSAVNLGFVMRREREVPWTAPLFPFMGWIIFGWLLTWAAVELDMFQRLQETVELSGSQWLIVIGLSLVTPVLVAIDKLLQIRRERGVEAGTARANA